MGNQYTSSGPNSLEDSAQDCQSCWPYLSEESQKNKARKKRDLKWGADSLFTPKGDAEAAAIHDSASDRITGCVQIEPPQTRWHPTLLS